MPEATFNAMAAQIDSFSFDQKLALLSMITTSLQKRESNTSGATNTVKKRFPNRRAGIAKDPNFYMAPDFDEPLEDFKEYM